MSFYTWKEAVACALGRLLLPPLLPNCLFQSSRLVPSGGPEAAAAVGRGEGAITCTWAPLAPAFPTCSISTSTGIDRLSSHLRLVPSSGRGEGKQALTHAQAPLPASLAKWKESNGSPSFFAKLCAFSKGEERRQ